MKTKSDLTLSSLPNVFGATALVTLNVSNLNNPMLAIPQSAFRVPHWGDAGPADLKSARRSLLYIHLGDSMAPVWTRETTEKGIQ